MKNSKNKPLKQLKQKLASRWWYFFNGSDWFNANGEKLSAAPKGFVIAVLARHCYRSQQSTWPIKSSSELQQVLRQKQPDSMHWIKSYANNQRVVSSVTVNENIRDRLICAQCVVPEHWLVNKAQKQNSFWQLESPAGKWFSARQGEDHNHVALAGVIKNLATARASLGVSDNIRLEALEWPQYKDLLINALSDLTLSQWQAVWRPKDTRKTHINWKAIGLSTAAVTILYAVLSTAYLHYLDYSRSKQLEAFGEQVDERLFQRSQMQQSVNRIRALSQLAGDKQQLLVNWNLIGFLYMNDVDVSRVSSQLGQLEITGRAESATDIAEKMTQLDHVASVTFASPVRRSRDLDAFTIQVKLVEENHG